MRSTGQPDTKPRRNSRSFAVCIVVMHAMNSKLEFGEA